jgi:murein DD-endopeptidase MepM/ murein hydrolase activator NlpD
MRKGAVAGSLVILLVLAVPFGAVLIARNAPTNPCRADGISQPLSGPVPKVDGLTAGQVRLAKIIWTRSHAHSALLGRRPDQAAIIAIAVASQESALGANPAIARPNADGDAGPFQQRTKPGWYGTLAQVTDPVYGADTFLLGHTVTAAQSAAARAAGSQPAGPAGYHIPGLANIAGWAAMDIIEAADRVQRPAFPDTVADDISLARRLVDIFRSSPDASAVNEIRAAVSEAASEGCGDTTSSTCPPTNSPGEHGLTPDTLLVLRCVKQAFPKIIMFYGVRSDPYPDHPSGRAVDIMISSAFPNYRSAEAVAYGNQIATWVRAHQKQLGVQYIIWRQHIWNVERASEGWRLMADRGNPTANHMDHVHVTTYGNSARAVDLDLVSTAGKAVTPVEHYTISARFGQVGSWARYHTGLDFAAPIGTPVRAALAGVVTHSGYGTAAAWAGDYVTIRHFDGTSTLYAHMARHDVRQGQAVTTGLQVGVIGMTGRSFGPHLHFEAYPRGVPPGQIYQAIDPAAWLRARSVSAL